MQFRFIIFVLNSFFFCSSAFALTLSEALDLALKNNSEIQLEKSRFETIKANKNDAIIEFLPEVKATYQRGKQQNDAVDLNRGELDQEGNQDVKQINLIQPLFNGFTSVNKSKEIQSDIKQAQFYYQFKKDEIFLKTITSYINLFRSANLVNLRKKSEEYCETLLNLVKQRNKEGDVAGNEVIDFETRLFNSKSENLLAQKELFKARQEFENYVGIVVIDSIKLPLIDKNKISDSAEKLIDVALNQNNNLAQFQFKIKSAKSALNQVRGQFSPKAEISASMARQENVTYLDNHDLKSKSVFLNITVPLFQQGREYSALQKANKELIFAKREFEVNKEVLIKDIKQTYKEYLFYENLVKSDEDLIHLIQNKITRLEQQVKGGEGDIIDLLASKIELNKILEQKTDNLIGYITSYYKLLVLVGNFDIGLVNNYSENSKNTAINKPISSQ